MNRELLMLVEAISREKSVELDVVMGAVEAALAQAATIRLLIPGSGAVESLNVASATSVLLSEWCRQRQA